MSALEDSAIQAVEAAENGETRTIYETAAWHYLNRIDPDAAWDLMNAVDDRRRLTTNPAAGAATDQDKP